MNRVQDSNYATTSNQAGQRRISDNLSEVECAADHDLDVAAAAIERKKAGIYGFDYADACRPTEDLLDGFVECVTSASGDAAFVIGEATDAIDPDTFSNTLILHYFRAAVAMGRAIDSRLAGVLNEIVCDARAGKGAVTCFCAQYVSKAKILRYCNAGHKSALLVRSNLREVFRLNKGGLALGAEQTARYREGSVHMRRGDRLLVCTQGVVESWATQDDVAAEAALIRILRGWGNESAVEIANLIVDDAPATAGNSQIDRIAMVASVGRAADLK
jgi:hypothetical protein